MKIEINLNYDGKTYALKNENANDVNDLDKLFMILKKTIELKNK